MAAALWCKESCHGENLIKIFAHPPSEKLPRRLELPVPGASASASARQQVFPVSGLPNPPPPASHPSCLVSSCNSFWVFGAWKPVKPHSRHGPIFRSSQLFLALSFLEQLSSRVAFSRCCCCLRQLFTVWRLTVNLCQANRETNELALLVAATAAASSAIATCHAYVL